MEPANERAAGGKKIDPRRLCPLRLPGPDEGDCMILAPLFGAALVVAVATGPLTDPAGEASLPAAQKIAATEPLVRSTTECITRAVFADPRYGNSKEAALGELIVDSV